MNKRLLFSLVLLLGTAVAPLNAGKKSRKARATRQLHNESSNSGASTPATPSDSNDSQSSSKRQRNRPGGYRSFRSALYCWAARRE